MVPATDPQRPEATRLGSYEILRKLARGGMAELFLARTVGPENFEKLVVLKKILPNFAENPKFVRLFLDEARLAATLDHPHIAHVYDMGRVDAHYFFTMEFIHGQDVRATLRRTARFDRQFPLDHAVFIVHAVAAALHYAHERRKPDGSLLDIVHRDVSPSNILISYDGAIKLVDFGVAKAATSSVKTRTGTLKGKIAYMSPEQAKGSPVDRRSDIFALGICLWEMITTQRLFKGDNDLATIQLIINSKPQPPRELRPECPEELERITLKALSSDPETRYQTAEELQLDLEELARELKLKQSTVALRAHMQELFAEEIKAWKAAQASGQTLTDHVVSASVVEMTTPVSENEVSFLEDDDDDEDEIHQLPTQGLIASPPPRAPIVAPVSPSVVVARPPSEDSAQAETITAPPPIESIPPPMPHTPSTRHRVPTPAHPMASRPQTIPPPMPMQPMQHVPSGPHRRVSEQNPVVAANAYPREPTAFPIAPREWRENKTPVAHDPNEAQRKKIIVGGLLTAALLAVIFLATGGSSPPAASVEVVPEPVEKTPVIDMHVEPPPAPPPLVVETKPEPPPPVVDEKPALKATPAPVTRPATTTTKATPTTTPPPKTDDHHHHSTTPKTDPKPDKSSHKLDPNSGLPPD